MSDPSRSTSSGGSAPERYKLLDMIGNGSFGEVWRALDMATGAEVAVKTVDLEET